MDEIESHVETRIGPIHMRYGEIVPGDPPLTVLHVKSSLFRRYEVIVTAGMSTRPMPVPEGSDEPRFAEVLAILPKGWPLSKADMDIAHERHYWPVRLLKDLARHPCQRGTNLGYGHTIGNGESEATTKPYAHGTQLCAAVLLPPMSLGEAAFSLTRADGETVWFLQAVPLHMDELKFTLEHGIDALLDLFGKHRVSPRIDPARPSVVEARR